MFQKVLRIVVVLLFVVLGFGLLRLDHFMFSGIETQEKQCGNLHVVVETARDVVVECSAGEENQAIVTIDDNTTHILTGGEFFINERLEEKGKDVSWKLLSTNCGRTYSGRSCQYFFYHLDFWIDFPPNNPNP